MMKFALCHLLLTVAAGAVDIGKIPTGPVSIIESTDIAPVWAGHPVGFALLTHAPFQFVAFYDDKRQLTVARRRITEGQWTFTKLPVVTRWDSHNYVTMAIDDRGFLHLSGDMHCVPLMYFRTEKPLDPATFEKIGAMVGTDEKRMTYPQFIRGPQQELIFTYRDGGSGNGNQLFNVYDPEKLAWKRLLDTSLTDGEGRRNAYFNGPVRGPDGWFHLSWVWRETPDAATNHDLSYARSKDLRVWETAAGKPLQLPIRINDKTIIDPVPQNGGMINGNHRIGFDDKSRVTISYHKHDAVGHTQPWTARLENDTWKFYQTTAWPWRWEFGGGGSLSDGIKLGPVNLEADGRLTQTYRHPEFGGGTWLLDPPSLRALGKTSSSISTPPQLGKVEGGFPGLKVKIASDSGKSEKTGKRYILRWETLEANRDRPRNGPLPKPSMLRVHAIQSISETSAGE